MKQLEGYLLKRKYVDLWTQQQNRIIDFVSFYFVFKWKEEFALLPFKNKIRRIHHES